VAAQRRSGGGRWGKPANPPRGGSPATEGGRRQPPPGRWLPPVLPPPRRWWGRLPPAAGAPAQRPAPADGRTVGFRRTAAVRRWGFGAPERRQWRRSGPWGHLSAASDGVGGARSNPPTCSLCAGRNPRGGSPSPGAPPPPLRSDPPKGLAMGRSPGFGSPPGNGLRVGRPGPRSTQRPALACADRGRFGCGGRRNPKDPPPAPRRHSPAHYAKGTVGTPGGALQRLRRGPLQPLFHSGVRPVVFHLSLTVLVRYRCGPPIGGCGDGTPRKFPLDRRRLAGSLLPPRPPPLATAGQGAVTA
jgi:hypothetical protein